MISTTHTIRLGLYLRGVSVGSLHVGATLSLFCGVDISIKTLVLCEVTLKCCCTAQRTQTAIQLKTHLKTPSLVAVFFLTKRWI